MDYVVDVILSPFEIAYYQRLMKSQAFATMPLRRYRVALMGQGGHTILWVHKQINNSHKKQLHQPVYLFEFYHQHIQMWYHKIKTWPLKNPYSFVSIAIPPPPPTTCISVN